MFIVLRGKFIQNTTYSINIYQNRPSFAEDMARTSWFTFFLDTVYKHSCIAWCGLLEPFRRDLL